MLCKYKIFFRCKFLFYFSERLFSYFLSYVFAYVVNDWLPVFAVVTCILITTLSVFTGMSAFQSPRNFLDAMHANFSSQMCKLHRCFPSLIGKKAGSLRKGVYLECTCWHSTETTVLWIHILLLTISHKSKKSDFTMIFKWSTRKWSNQTSCIWRINLKLVHLPCLKVFSEEDKEN